MYPIVLIFPFCGPQSSKVCLLTSSYYICFVFLSLIQDPFPSCVFLFPPERASVLFSLLSLCRCQPALESRMDLDVVNMFVIAGGTLAIPILAFVASFLLWPSALIRIYYW